MIIEIKQVTGEKDKSPEKEAWMVAVKKVVVDAINNALLEFPDEEFEIDVRDSKESDNEH